MVKLKDIPNLMISVQKSLIGNNVKYGYQKAILEQGKRKITLNREALVNILISKYEEWKNSKSIKSGAQYLADEIISNLPTLLECKETNDTTP